MTAAAAPSATSLTYSSGPTSLTYPSDPTPLTYAPSPSPAISPPRPTSPTASRSRPAPSSWAVVTAPPAAPSQAAPSSVTTLAHPTGVPGATLDEAAPRRAVPAGLRSAGPTPRAVVVGVVGACGGVGASTLAAAVALAGVHDGLRAVLVDARHAGAGIDVLLGIEEEPGLRWADLQDARGEVDPVRLLDLLPQWSGVHVLSSDRARALARPDEVERDVLRAVVAAADLVVLDLSSGRVAGCAQSCDVAVVVALCETLSVAGTQAVVGDLDLARSGVVCRGSAAGRLLPHDVAAAVGMDLWGEIVTDPRIAAAVEAGAGPAVRVEREPARRRRWRSGGRRDGRGRPPLERRAARTSLGYVARAVLAHARAVAGAGQVGR